MLVLNGKVVLLVGLSVVIVGGLWLFCMVKLICLVVVLVVRFVLDVLMVMV